VSHEVETMAYANEVPWHGLGANISADATVDEMLKASGLEWQLRPHPLFIKVGAEGAERMIQVPEKRAFVRDSDDKIMTVASRAWRPLQNRDMLEFFRDYSEAGGVKLETAGSLRGGQIVWALASLDHNYEISRGDKVRGFILFISPHKVGSAITIRTTSVRVVCANTMAMAIGKNGQNGQMHYSQNHLSEFDFSKAKEQVESAHEQLVKASKNAALLRKLKMTEEDRRRFVAQLVQPALANDEQSLMNEDNFGPKMKGILSSVMGGPGAEPDNAMGMLSGIQHWADHVAGRSAQARLFRSWLGDLGELKLTAEKKLLEMAE
jgi:phage/plasmid-like protein (TIGR03299 family)